MEARRILRAAETSEANLTAGQLYRLHFLATGDRAHAERIAKARMWAQLKAGGEADSVG